MTSLHWAAMDGRTDIVKILVKHGANVSTKDNDGIFIFIFYLSIY